MSKSNMHLQQSLAPVQSDSRDRFILKNTISLTDYFTSLKNQLNNTHEAHCAGLLTPLEMSHRLTKTEVLCDKISKLINELADISNTVKVDELQVQLQDSNLVDIAADVLEQLMDLAIEKRCRLSFHATEVVIGEWDVQRLQQLLTHLILNAINHGCSSAEVKITSNEHYAQIEVKDTGPGIPIFMRSKIFKRVTKSDVTSENSDNGLWLVKEIVERLHGTLHLVSSLEVGTTFFIELPLRQMLH